MPLKHGVELALKAPSWDSTNSQEDTVTCGFSLFAPFGSTCMRSSLAHQTIIQEEKKHLNKDDDVLGGDQLPRAQVLGSLP